MKNSKDILKNLGFNENAPESTKNAFLRNLQQAMKNSDKAEVIPVPNKKSGAAQAPSEKINKGTQLSFDFSKCGNQ